MSKYQKYGKELDELMRQRFSDFEKAERAYNKAKKDLDGCPMKEGLGVTREYQIKAMKYQIAFEEAKHDYEEARKIYQGIVNEANQIRSALYAELERDLAVNPKDLDRNVVDLLASGICTAKEVSNLFETAENNTTRRYIASFADKQDLKKMTNEDASIMRKVAHNRRLFDPDQSVALRNFDVAMDVVNRCSKNTAMIGYWGQLTEGPLSDM